jgi:D-sedoheptulose 7-phosphate isomerase
MADARLTTPLGGVLDAEQFLKVELGDHAAVLHQTGESISAVFSQVVGACLVSLRAGKKVLLFGNGGSAADAQHLATELVVRHRANRPAIAAIALTTDTSALTAIGNDLGFDNVFARQVEALCVAGDVAIGISTSGSSENVIRGLEAAKLRGAVTVGMAGGDGGRLVGLVDHAIIIPSTVTARIQEMHLLIGHTLCALLEKGME